MKNKTIIFLVIIFISLMLGLWLSLEGLKFAMGTPAEICRKTWTGYKHLFITREGRVVRPKEKDTVSEGQAYAMLRSVWMDDKDTFDRCYAWAERNLSRSAEKGDNLLAWQWKEGRVADWMPASDADVDYALALVFADSQWHGRAPEEVADYGEKARAILGDILRIETYRSADSRLYLLPWIIDNPSTLDRLPLNPSYYSPGHFRVFLFFTGDERWQELIGTSYHIFGSLARGLGVNKGTGLVPDWCSVDKEGMFYPLEEKSSDFGWEAVRVPLRVALDHSWFQSSQAKEFFDSGISEFLESQWQDNKAIFSEYSYDGTGYKRYENALFYAAYSSVLMAGDSPHTSEVLLKARSFVKQSRGTWFYQDQADYFTNSLAWFTEGIRSGIIRNICAKTGEGN